MPPTRRSTRTVPSTLARDSAQPYTRADTCSGSPSAQPSTASLSRSPVPSGKQSLKLTVKAAPSKLRQATSGSSIPPNPYAADNPSESDATPVPASRTTRSTRNPRTVVDNDSDDDDAMDVDAEQEDDDDDDDDEGDEDAEGGEVDQELLANEDSEDDAEGEEDEDMDDHPAAPIIKQSRPPGQSKPSVTVTAPTSGPLKSVEAKETEDDDELSDLESGDENEHENEHELDGLDDEEEGEEDEGEEEEEEEEEDNDDDSDPDNSRSATPDMSKLTRRQRGAFEEDANLMALSNEAQKKKHLSVEEHNMRRQEMARRRKNLSDKRNEEEKMDTINKLLQKPAPKRRTRAEILAAQLHGTGTPGAEDEESEGPRADPVYTRWVSSKEGCRVGAPDEWLEGPVGEVFGGPVKGSGGGRMVEEVA